MMTVTVQTEDGVVVFVGLVDEDKVKVTRFTNRPSECLIAGSMLDCLHYLSSRLPAESGSAEKQAEEE